jgi:hypothetical protein
MDREPEISIGDDQITGFKPMLLEFLQSSFDSDTAAGSFENFFHKESTGAVRAERLKDTSVANPDEDTVLIDT